MDEIYNYMATPVLWIDAQETVEKGAQYLCDNDVSSLLVKEKEEFVGIVTLTDMVKRVVAKGLDPKTVRMHSIMSQPVMKMDHYFTRADAHAFMAEKNIKHLAITKNGKIVGILSIRDLLSRGNQDNSSFV